MELCGLIGSADGTSLNTTRLCFIILTCIAEDQYANSIMHDVNMQYKVVNHEVNSTQLSTQRQRSVHSILVHLTSQPAQRQKIHLFYWDKNWHACIQ